MRSKDRIAAALAVVCVAAWLIAAIDPFDRAAWLLENILLVIFAGILIATRKHLQLSTASEIAIAVFVLLHIVGAHYTYAQMPLGLWAKEAFDLSRNHYDRVAHGSFGLLLALPVHELLLRFAGITRSAGYWLPPVIILALSGMFEIIEAVVAHLTAPGEGVTWLGGQGDEWDAQNDILVAWVGAVTMMAIVALVERSRKRTT